MGNGRTIFVIGPAASGKSHYVATFPAGTRVVDLYDFQDGSEHGADDIMRTYEACRDALAAEIRERAEAKSDYDIVLEHTLLMARRRPMYVDAARDAGAGDIECMYALPTEGQMYALMSMRLGVPVEAVAMMYSGYVKAALETFEIPTTEEGFSSVGRIPCAVPDILAGGRGD